MPTFMTKDQVKQAAISVCIGFAISLLTIAFQATIAWLHAVQPEIPGAVIGMAKYIHWSKTNGLS